MPILDEIKNEVLSATYTGRQVQKQTIRCILHQPSRGDVQTNTSTKDSKKFRFLTAGTIEAKMRLVSTSELEKVPLNYKFNLPRRAVYGTL